MKPGLWHRAFDVVVVLKGLNGLLELIGSAALLFVPNGLIATWVDGLTRTELAEDRGDIIANALRHWAEGLGRSIQLFVVYYLLFHGVAKLTLASLLFMEKRSAFPVAIAFFSAFVVYAIYRLSIGWSWTLLGLIMLDIVTIAIVAREWRAISHQTTIEQCR
jgi:uncharacterized membrane protein